MNNTEWHEWQNALRRIATLERELTFSNDQRVALADRVSELQGELDEAVRAGAWQALKGRVVVPPGGPWRI